MQLQLKSYVVAFIDLLGFSVMVKHDCETPNGDQKFIEGLYECHIQTKNLKKDYPDLQLIQFSDSVVFALPYSTQNYISIIKMIAEYQYVLLGKGILCRGGISYGKHFSTEDFLFSNGMIEAYKLESKVAFTPRVVISNELLDLVSPNIAEDFTSLPIAIEDDGLFFVNYLFQKNPQEACSRVKMAVSDKLSKDPAIRSKQVWLINLCNHNYPEVMNEKINKFSYSRYPMDPDFKIT